MSPVLILRPQPGADATAEAARQLGLKPEVAPIFELHPLAWQPPDPARFDAVMITSANAARHGGEGLGAFFGLSCYAVGEASAAAAREAGFEDVRTGPENGDALLAMMGTDGVRAAFHPCGLDRTPLAADEVRVEAIPVYAAEALDRLPAAARAAIDAGALALLHSTRAAARFAALIGERRSTVAIAAISESAAVAAGEGWRAVAIADKPRDAALLALAVELCQTRVR